MAHLIDNSFSCYHLTEEEEIQGSLLTTTQKQVIQNQIAMLAEQKISIRYDPNDPIVFAQEEAEKLGAIEALKYLLTLSIAAEEAMTFKEEGQDLSEYSTVSAEASNREINDIFPD